jgi:hypothetical protein
MLSRPIQSGRPHGHAPLGLDIAIGILVVVVAGCAIVVGAALWTALVRMEPAGPTVEHSRAIADTAARLACCDQIAVPAARWPAKGAVAPLPHPAP